VNPNAIKSEERDMNAALEARPLSRERRTKSHSKVQRILVAVDLSGWSKATVIHAAGIADLFGAAVTLIHVFDPEGITKIAGDRVYDSLDDARRDAEKRLSGLVEEIRKFYPECDMEFRIGEPSGSATKCRFGCDCESSSGIAIAFLCSRSSPRNLAKPKLSGPCL
jgi:hypothetical protein